MNRSSDHNELQRQAQAAQVQVTLKRRQRDKEMKVVFEPRKRNWTRAFEMIGLQGLAIGYVALGMGIGYLLALIIGV